jgi:2-C-methyl-D-erythritol 2,4-cyclodiphosphate synthase
MRIGIGYDIHRLKKGRKLFLGGVQIRHNKGLDGHSDADVLLHAISDALLGAAGEPDIGVHFPNTNPKYKGISSLELLKNVMGIITKKGFRVNNVDSVVVAEEPRIIPFTDKMKDKIAFVLKVDKERINIKATTNEGVGVIGRGEAISSYAVAMLLEAKL